MMRENGDDQLHNNEAEVREEEDDDDAASGKDDEDEDAARNEGGDSSKRGTEEDDGGQHHPGQYQREAHEGEQMSPQSARRPTRGKTVTKYATYDDVHVAKPTKQSKPDAPKRKLTGKQLSKKKQHVEDRVPESEFETELLRARAPYSFLPIPQPQNPTQAKVIPRFSWDPSTTAELRDCVGLAPPEGDAASLLDLNLTMMRTLRNPGVSTLLLAPYSCSSSSAASNGTSSSSVNGAPSSSSSSSLLRAGAWGLPPTIPREESDIADFSPATKDDLAMMLSYYKYVWSEHAGASLEKPIDTLPHDFLDADDGAYEADERPLVRVLATIVLPAEEFFVM